MNLWPRKLLNMPNNKFKSSANSLFIDTNIIYETLVNPSFRPYFQGIVSEYNIQIHISVLLELGNLVKKIYGSSFASKLISKYIDEFPIYPLIQEDVIQGLQVMDKYDFNKPKKDYTLTDAIQLICADKEKCGILSLDHELAYYKFKSGGYFLFPEGR